MHTASILQRQNAQTAKDSAADHSEVAAHQTQTALDVPAGSALKADISNVIQSALDGSDESLRYAQHWIRWGLVEKRIHALVDATFASPNNRDDRRRAPDSAQPNGA